jgi:hypothetical protein
MLWINFGFFTTIKKKGVGRNEVAQPHFRITGKDSKGNKHTV